MPRRCSLNMSVVRNVERPNLPMCAFDRLTASRDSALCLKKERDSKQF